MILLPCSDYSRAAALFTERALIKQIEEIAQTLELIMEGERVPAENSGWDSYPYSLALYGKALIQDHEVRSGETHPAIEVVEDVLSVVGDYSRPWWIEREAIHLSHQGVMGRKKLGVTEFGGHDLPVLRAAILYGHKVILVEANNEQ